MKARGILTLHRQNCSTKKGPTSVGGWHRVSFTAGGELKNPRSRIHFHAMFLHRVVEFTVIPRFIAHKCLNGGS